MSHWTEFAPEWWTERRRRDYYVDSDGYVRLDPMSKTGQALATYLESAAMKIALDMTPTAGATKH